MPALETEWIQAGGEPASRAESSTEASPSGPQAAEGSSRQLPFRHRSSELDRQRWKELRSMFIDELKEDSSSKEEPKEANRLIPYCHRHKDDSIFLSGRAQLLAVDQFTLQKDLDILKEMPSSDLRMALQSYHIRGALIGEELYNRYDHLIQIYDKLTGELAEERKAQEEADKKILTDAKWRKEMEVKQKTIANLQIHHTKQLATIEKLRGEAARLGKVVENSLKESTEKEEKVKSLEEELENERHERVSAHNVVQSNQLTLQHLKVELEEAKTAREIALADLSAIEVRLKHVTSDAGKKEVIDEYHHGPIGRMELSLAVKVGFDYLRA